MEIYRHGQDVSGKWRVVVYNGKELMMKFDHNPTDEECIESYNKKIEEENRIIEEE